MIARLLIAQHLNKRVEETEKILSEAGLSKSHVDCLYFPFNSKLGIEQARKIKEHFSLKPYSSIGRAVVLENAASLTPEAQNALLKTLEEPPLNAILILGASSEAKFLPTILSRCQIVNLSPSAMSADNSPVDPQNIQQLLNSTIQERFEYIEKLKEREDFLSTLIQYFRKQLSTAVRSGSNPHISTLQKFLKELLQAEEWSAQNVNIRAILEYLMLVMPSKEW